MLALLHARRARLTACAKRSLGCTRAVHALPHARHARLAARASCAGATSWALLYPLETLRSRVTTGAAASPEGLRGLAGLLRAIVAK